MNIKDFFIFVYGLFMGTSTGYLKARRSYQFPRSTEELAPELFVQWGGTANCGIFHSPKEILLINTGREQGALELLDYVKKIAAENRSRWLVFTSDSEDDSGGIEYFRGFDRVRQDIRLSGGEIAHLRKIGEATIILFAKKRVLFTGRLFFNRVHPPLKDIAKPIEHWLGQISQMREFEADVLVPGEGSRANFQDLENFEKYLRDLADPNLDLSALRERYADWQEIIGTSSLSENFEFARGIVVK